MMETLDWLFDTFTLLILMENVHPAILPKTHEQPYWFKSCRYMLSASVESTKGVIFP